MSQNLDAEEVLKQVIPHFIGQIERAWVIMRVIMWCDVGVCKEVLHYSSTQPVAVPYIIYKW